MYRRSLDAKPTCGVHARPSSDVFSKCKKPHFLIRESCMQMAFAHLGMRELRAVIFSQGTLKLLKTLLRNVFIYETLIVKSPVTSLESPPPD